MQTKCFVSYINVISQLTIDRKQFENSINTISSNGIFVGLP